MTPAPLLVPRRFCGPPGSGNGGWCAGALAGRVPVPSTGAAVEVRLRRPPPLEVAMTVTERDGWTVATHDDEVVLQARPATADPVPAPLVPVEQARAAEAAYGGHVAHAFPGCFSCGPERAEGDGLRIFPGPVGVGLVAATWRPVDEPDAATTWAALDCAGAWAAGVDEQAMVLGSMTARLARLPEAGAELVVVGEHRRSDGRRRSTATTLRTGGGEVVGTSEQVWFTVDAAAFR